MESTPSLVQPALVDEERPQPVERKFFLANLSYSTVDGDLFSFFSSFGQVEMARIVRDRLTGASRGFGFLTMRDEDGALAVTELAATHNNTIEMLGRSNVHIAVHDRERQKQKADERRQQAYGGGGGGGPGLGPYGGGGSFTPPYHPHGHGHGHGHHQGGVPSYGGGFQPSMQMQPLLQPTMHQTQIMAPPKVSIGGGNGGPPYELLVENLPNSVSIDELVAKFSSFGTVNGASLRQAVGESAGRPSYAKIRFANPESLASAVTSHHIPTAHHHHRHHPDPRPHQPRQSNTAGTDGYGLWRPHSKSSGLTSVPTQTIRADSAEGEGSLSTWSGSGSAGNGTTPTFTPPRIGRGGGRGPRPPGF